MMTADLAMAALFGFGMTVCCEHERLPRILVETQPERTAIPV